MNRASSFFFIANNAATPTMNNVSIHYKLMCPFHFQSLLGFFDCLMAYSKAVIIRHLIADHLEQKMTFTSTHFN
jgi:hypothetical protein